MVTLYYWVNGSEKYPQDTKYLQVGDTLYINPTQEIWLSLGFELVGEEVDDTPAPQERPSYDEVVQALLSLNTQVVIELGDGDAVQVAALFPAWADNIGETLNVGERYYYGGVLYKVIQAHTAQENWTPAVSSSLFQVVSSNVAEDGTLQHPYTWESGMECFEGKYYSESGVTYLCIRNSGTPLHYSLADLVGTYFQLV